MVMVMVMDTFLDVGLSCPQGPKIRLGKLSKEFSDQILYSTKTFPLTNLLIE